MRLGVDKNGERELVCRRVWGGGVSASTVIAKSYAPFVPILC